MNHRIKVIAALVALAAGTGLTAADAAPHRRSRHAIQHHAMRQAPVQSQGYGYAPRAAYDNGFNPLAPVAGVLGAAATVATAPIAIATGNAPFGYADGYAPAYGAPYGYGYGYDDEGRGWPKRGPFYETW